MSDTAATLHAALSAHLPIEARTLLVALSGGADSAALLTVLHAEKFRQLPLRAVHIDHGLQPAAAAAFRGAAQALCDLLEVPLKVVSVAVDVSAGVSIEAAAREARYAALAEEVGESECLLTAHHREDQAETVLLQALRGAGLKGMAAMPACRPFGRGWHARPLLDMAQSELLQLGGEQLDGEQLDGLTALDPMNADLRFDRSFLRQQLWPLVTGRWPGAGAALSRAARHMAQAQDLMDLCGQEDLAKLRDGDALSITGLRVLSPAKRSNAVRLWLSEAGVELPSTARLEEALRQVLNADEDHVPAIVWSGHAMRRYRQRLFLTAAQPPRVPERLAWSMRPAVPLILGENLGSISLAPQWGGLDPRCLPDVLQVRRREGGETLRPAPLAKTQTVQHLCQSLGVLPWMRDSLPFVFAGDELVAVGDLWQEARFCAAQREPGLRIAWREAPIVV
jgi:tRNA(Ile)-lysidine synthase